MHEAETSFILLLSNAMPYGLKGLLLVTFILGFITSFEAIMNWGASMISVDLLGNSTLVKENKQDVIGYLSMGLIALLSLLLAIFSGQIYFLLKLLLSISIGVGPVFILRWFWWRVNAWSQLSAMIASFIFAVSFDWYYENFSPEFIDAILLQNEMSWYVFKLLVITPLVTLVWIVVTFVTKADDLDHLRNFVNLTKTSGFWPFPSHKFYWKKKLIAIVLFGFAGVLPIWIVWILKFQSLFLGISLSLVWLIIVTITFYLMKSILHKNQT
jgi:Na+/proline symporter